MNPEIKSMIMVGSLALVGIIILVGLLRVLIKNYIRIAPNKAAVLYGRKNKSAAGDMKGYRLITGGGVSKFRSLKKFSLLIFQTASLILRLKTRQIKTVL